MSERALTGDELGAIEARQRACAPHAYSQNADRLIGQDVPALVAEVRRLREMLTTWVAFDPQEKYLQGSDYYVCLYCDEGSVVVEDHAPECVWRRAREYLHGSNAAGETGQR